MRVLVHGGVGFIGSHTVVQLVERRELLGIFGSDYDTGVRDCIHVQDLAGVSAACNANLTRARVELGGRTEKTSDNLCADTWRWQSQNPQGHLE